MSSVVVVLCSFLYLTLLFAIAYVAESRKRAGKSVIDNSWVYALSMGVYCTAWTYYGSVGRASVNGMEFLSIYIGPTIMAGLFPVILNKILHISKLQRINSIADLISSRYGKSISIGVIVSVFCLVGIVPYIALQLKAISLSYNALLGSVAYSGSMYNNSTFYTACILALFIILFGTRSIDTTEKHEGMVAAIAFETIVKLLAFILAGVIICYGVFNGFGDVFHRASQSPELRQLFSLQGPSNYMTWFVSVLLSMIAILFLPRQFQVSVIENVQSKHVRKAVWILPLYLFIMNIFVFPIALAGKILFAAGTVDPDTYVIAIPTLHGYAWMGVVIFIGGFSAASSMIIVETIAISTMVSNNIVLPILLSARGFDETSTTIQRVIVLIRRASILFVILLAYLYDTSIAQHFSLVSIGLTSFTAVAQFAPALIGGLYWRKGNKNGAISGICAGFVVWAYTLIVPSMAHAHMVDSAIIESGLFGVPWLKPLSLFGLDGFDSITHGAIWSLLINTSVYVVVSMHTKAKAQERYQAEIFVNAFRMQPGENSALWVGTAYVQDLLALLESFLGKDRSVSLVTSYATRNKITVDATKKADPRLVDFAERILAGVIGSASARIIVRRATQQSDVHIDEVLKILHESQQNIELNKELRRKSAELHKATDELRLANEQLRDLDAQKDEFLYTVTHELRTPLTSIRSLTEIVHDNPDIDEEQRQEFLGAVVRETERLSHLITQVLNLERYESGRQKLDIGSCDLVEVFQDVEQALRQLLNEKKIELMTMHAASLPAVVDERLIRQVFENLLSNAIKFSPSHGAIHVELDSTTTEIRCAIQNSGAGIDPDLHELIFDKFFQAKNQTLKKPVGSGLGLSICKKIVEMHGGRIWVESKGAQSDEGSRFIFVVPHRVEPL